MSHPNGAEHLVNVVSRQAGGSQTEIGCMPELAHDLFPGAFGAKATPTPPKPKRTVQMWRREGKPLSEISFWLKHRKDARDLERYQFAFRSLSSASLVCWHPRLASPASLRRLSSFTRASTARKPHEPSAQDFLPFSIANVRDCRAPERLVRHHTPGARDFQKH